MTDAAAREDHDETVEGHGTAGGHEEMLSRQAADATAAAWEAQQLAQHLRESGSDGDDRAEDLERLATSQRVVSELAALALDRRQDPVR